MHLYQDSNHPVTITTKFEEFRNQTRYIDITIKTKDRKFPAHKNILAASSQYWVGRFAGGFAEANQDTVPLHNIDADSFAQILRYVYTGQFEVNSDTVEATCFAADYLQYEFIKKSCITFMRETLCPDSSIENPAKRNRCDDDSCYRDPSSSSAAPDELSPLAKTLDTAAPTKEELNPNKPHKALLDELPESERHKKLCKFGLKCKKIEYKDHKRDWAHTEKRIREQHTNSIETSNNLAPGECTMTEPSASSSSPDAVATPGVVATPGAPFAKILPASAPTTHTKELNPHKAILDELPESERHKKLCKFGPKCKKMKYEEHKRDWAHTEKRIR